MVCAEVCADAGHWTVRYRHANAARAIYATEFGTDHRAFIAMDGYCDYLYGESAGWTDAAIDAARAKLERARGMFPTDSIQWDRITLMLAIFHDRVLDEPEEAIRLRNEAKTYNTNIDMRALLEDEEILPIQSHRVFFYEIDVAVVAVRKLLCGSRSKRTGTAEHRDALLLDRAFSSKA